MKKITLIFAGLLIAILLGGWSSFPQQSGQLFNTAYAVPAAEGDPELTINNQTGAVFYVTLTGPQTYTVQVAAGKNYFSVVKGEYTLSYFACGAQQTAEVNVKKNGASIKLTCDTPKAGKGTQLTFDNKSGANLYVTLAGTKNYAFNVPPGKTKFPVESGTYDISYFACGAQNTVSFFVKPKGGTLKILCIALTIVNLTDAPFNLELEGPANYFFNIPVGKKTFNITPGTYTWTATGQCGTGEGVDAIKKKINWYFWCN